MNGDIQLEAVEDGSMGRVAVGSMERPAVGSNRKKGNGRKGPSWQNVTKILFTGESGVTRVIVECNLCKLQVPTDSSKHGTTIILKHLRKCPRLSLFEGPD